VLAAVGAVLLHHRFPWVPPWYLAAWIVVPVGAWLIARRKWRLRWTAPVLAVLVLGALLPVPWMTARLDQPPGNAWRLDGRVEINGKSVNPAGEWYWLTVGRPPIVAEVVRGWFTGRREAPKSMTGARLAQRPAIAEPVAAAVGLRRAGWHIDAGITVEMSDPIEARLPGHAVVSMVNGLNLTNRDVWDQALASLQAHNTFTTAGGDSFEFDGDAMPYRRVDVIDTPLKGFEAVVGGPLAKTFIGKWWRNLALGSSHGLMVALVSYVYGSGQDLARGRAIAGTGGIRGDGSVVSIGGLWAKATAARNVGADVMLFPAQQASQLRGFNPKGMRLIGVSSLDEAIAALST
jgi:hypothetical protein